MRPFVWDFARYATASVVLTLVPYALMSAGHISAGGIIMGLLLLPLIWLGPLVVVIRALRRKSVGKLLGALCAVPLLLLYQEVRMQMDARQIEALDQRQFLPPQSTHDIVVIQNSYFSSLEGTARCSELCLQMLFDSRYTPATQESADGIWTVFRLAHGHSCVENPEASRYLELINRRYVDTCIAVRLEPPHMDALIIRENFYKEESELRAKSPLDLNAHEYLERINNQDRLLGRWVTGTVEPSNTLFFFWGVGQRAIGRRFDDLEFYSAALGVPFEKLLPRGKASVPEILDAIRPFFDNPKTAGTAMDIFQNLARSGDGSSNAELLRQYIQARAEELKASPNPDSDRVHWLEDWAKRL